MNGTQGLLSVMHLPPRVVEVTKTSDGMYLAREQGDCGFNFFLGRPNSRPQAETVELAWQSFRQNPRGIVKAARMAGVVLRDFLPKAR